MARVRLSVVVALGVVLVAAAVSAGAEPKVEEQVVGPAGRADFKYSLSARGLHLGAVVMKGSRFAVVVDGVEGPQFDEVYATAPKFQSLPDIYGDPTQHALAGVSVVAFSPDGTRYAYAARDSRDVVVIVDGKETFRAPYSPSRQAVNLLMFSPDGKHVYFQTPTTDTMYSSCLIMDGQRGPACAEFVWPVFSPDGSRWAYYGKRPTPDQQSFTVVDGKVADYHAGRLRYTPDGKRLVGVTTGTDGKTSLVIDGKPVGPAGQVERIAISSTGDVGAVVQTGQTRLAYVNGKPVPGSESAFGIAFSPDGKRTAVRCSGGSPPLGWQVIDGKKGREYSGVGDCVFTADGSKAIYTAEVQGQKFVIVDGQEFGPYYAVYATPTVSATGAHYAFTAGNPQGRVLVVDGKEYPAGREVESFSFTRDGARHAFLASADLMSRTLIIDGKQYNAAVPAGTPVLFSADGKHVATIATPPGGRSAAFMIDDGFIPLPAGADQVRLCAFSPDGKHLVWRCGQQQKDGKATTDVYVNGRRVAQFERIMVGLPQELWEMGADGTFAVLGTAEGGAAIKRVRVALASADGGVEQWAAEVKAEQEKAAAAAAKKIADDKAAAEKAAADAKAAREKAIADRKAAQEKAAADRAAAREKAAADRKAAAEKAAAERAAKAKPQPK